MEKKELTVKEMASLGGKAIKKKYGKKYFKELAKKSVAKRKELAKKRRDLTNA